MTETVAIERAKQLFRFLKAFAERGAPTRNRISDHRWSQWLRDLPDHPTISIGEVQLASASDAAGSENTSDSALITVARPRTTDAPEPPGVLRDWLAVGWRDPEKPVEVRESRNVQRNGETITEQFSDDPDRLAAFETWRATRDTWAEAERPARGAMKVFEKFYDLKGRIDRESEGLELVIGDGRLRWNDGQQTIDHPVLLQRVELMFDPDVPEFRVVDTDRDPELYTGILQGTDAIAPQQINALRAEVERGGYHPLAREGTNAVLRRLVQTIAANGTFHDVSSEAPITSQPVISRDPVLFLRDRSSGFPAAFDRVLADIETNAQVPIALTRLVGVEPALPPQVELGEASPWGEPPDILLSKPANEEQIQIARALNHHHAVLVQGPPGTGKSHTIANLVGHLVAEGKRVLITSHTTKALRVLRGQIVDTLKPLCVALLDNDLEGRAQMEQAVKGILARLANANQGLLERDIASLSENRANLNARIANITRDLRIVRESEYLPIVFAGESIAPSGAARWVNDNAAGNDWIPGPVEAGAPLPLSADDVRELYETNERVDREEEIEIGNGLPPMEAIATTDAFKAWVLALDATEPSDLAQFWERHPAEADLPTLERLSDIAKAASEHLIRAEPWQRELIAIGHHGDADLDLWKNLEALVENAYRCLQKAKPQLLQHDPQLPSGMPADDAARVSKEIETHLDGGGSLGALSLMLHGEWKAFIRAARCNDRQPSSIAELRALRAFGELEGSRARLGQRWRRQAEPVKLPSFDSFGGDPEPKIREYSSQFGALLEWWKQNWAGLMEAASNAQFRWRQFREREVARSAPRSPFERDIEILHGPLLDAVGVRVGVCRRIAAVRLLNELESTLSHNAGPRTLALRRAVRDRDPDTFGTAREALSALWRKVPIVERRRTLLEKLRPAAPDWASAIEKGRAGHDTALERQDVAAAWRWAQIDQEVRRRAALDEIVLMRALERARTELREATVRLIDRKAWLAQMQRVDLRAQQALQGWALVQKDIGKGTGKRVNALRAEARRLLGEARDAVPVWIMPLARVAESFDARSSKFDVVIIDEASQSDLTGLLAWYLGERVAVVGDHEQVSPLAVGQQIDATVQLISEYLSDIPNGQLYSGKRSVYDLARASFGGTIALREHFRCVPNIIDFSNYLSYDGKIRPLRDPTRVPKPHVVEHVVSGSRLGREKRNLEEARAVVSIMKALTERPDHARATMGAISLLGEDQAWLIQELAVQVLGAVDLERRRFAAGNAAQFQGDERDIMFLSMVDSPTGGVLRLSDADATKQRYNVAASRARDQLWLIHSLNPARDLSETDLRRKLIEHVRDPSARRGAIQRALARAESPFERSMLERLISAGYRAEPQVWVGQYRIDMVVSDDEGQVALECDGDRFHGPDQIPADMARQAILERAGWRFIRVRGTRYYRDPDATIDWVFAELARLGVRPSSTASEGGVTNGSNRFREAVLARAWEIMRDKGWIEQITVDDPDAAEEVPA